MARTRSVAGMLLVAAATLVAPSHAAPADPGWRPFSDPSSRTRVDYPANIFSVEEGSFGMAPGQRFGTADGRAHFVVFTMTAEKSGSPAAFVARNLQVPRAALDYRRVSAKFFALSGVHEGEIYYVRCNTGSDRSVLHCIYLIYPAAEKRAWDPIVTRISRTLRP